MSTSTLSRAASVASPAHGRVSTRPLEYASTPPLDHLTIRPSNPDDLPALRRLAALDSAAMPRGRMLLAEVDGQLRAALALNDGRVVADPFVRTLELVELLRRRGRGPTGKPRPGRLRRPSIARRSTGLGNP